MLLRESDLTFERIAHEWARELDDAKNPGRLNRNEIFLNMVRRVWRGNFEDEEGENPCLTMTMSPARQPGGKWVDEHHQRTKKPRKIITITRRELLYMLWSDCPPGVTLPPRQKLSPFPDPETGEPPVPWSELKTEIPWGALDALTLDEYSPTFRECYLEALTISKDDKDDFGRWCDEQGHQRPQFWFGEQADARAVTPEPAVIAGGASRASEGGRPTFKSEIKVAYQELLADGDINFDAPKIRLYDPIREKVREYKGDLSLQRGLGKEAIRKVISPLFEADKNRRFTSP